MYKALKLLTHKPKPEKKRKREVILGRSLKSSKQKRKKAQKKKAIESQRLRHEVEAHAISLMWGGDMSPSLTCYSAIQYGQDILAPSPLVKMAAHHKLASLASLLTKWLYTVPDCGAELFLSGA